MSVETSVGHDIKNAALAAEGKKRIEWAERNMPYQDRWPIDII